jgi:hypothetical protein
MIHVTTNPQMPRNWRFCSSDSLLMGLGLGLYVCDLDSGVNHVIFGCEYIHIQCSTLDCISMYISVPEVLDVRFPSSKGHRNEHSQSDKEASCNSGQSSSLHFLRLSLADVFYAAVMNLISFPS